MLRTCRLANLSVCLVVRNVYCGKTADWIRMPFGMVSGVGEKIGVLDGGGDRRRRRGSCGVNLGRPIVIWGICYVAVRKCVQQSSCRLGWRVGWAQALMY